MEKSTIPRERKYLICEDIREIQHCIESNNNKFSKGLRIEFKVTTNSKKGKVK